MSVNTWSLKQRIKELTNENNELRRKRAELEEKVAARARQEEEILSSRPKPSQSAGSDTSAPPPIKCYNEDMSSQPSSPLKKCLALAHINASGLKFSNEQREVLGDWEKYEANGVVGSVHFHIKFTWNELLRKANGIEITFPNVFHKQELGPWLGICIRKNNVKNAILSIVDYSVLLSERENTLQQIMSTHESKFRSEKSPSKRLYVLEISDSDCKYLDANWTVKWDKDLGSLCHALTFDVAKTPEAKAMSAEHRHILKGLHSLKLQIDDIKKGLIQLIEGFAKRPQQPQ